MMSVALDYHGLDPARKKDGDFWDIIFDKKYFIAYFIANFLSFLKVLFEKKNKNFEFL